jgi:hypothetical protein
LAQASCRTQRGGGCLFFSEGWDVHTEALVGAFHEIQDRPLTDRPGRLPGPQMIQNPEFCYAQLVKGRKQRRVVATQKRVIFETEDIVDMDSISTSRIEREKFSIRQDKECLSRKAIGFSKCSEMLNHQIAFYLVDMDFVKGILRYLKKSMRKW